MPVFLMLGWEQVLYAVRFRGASVVAQPAHVVRWATAFGGIHCALTRYRAGAIAIWIGVVSHWVLDWVTHRPDMPCILAVRAMV